MLLYPSCLHCSRISVRAKNGAVIQIDDASADDTILSIKERVFASNRLLPVLRQQLVFSDRPDDIDVLADDETLGGACVAQDGSAELDVQLTIVRKEKARKLGPKVSYASAFPCCLLLLDAMMHQFEIIIETPRLF